MFGVNKLTFGAGFFNYQLIVMRLLLFITTERVVYAHTSYHKVVYIRFVQFITNHRLCYIKLIL